MPQSLACLHVHIVFSTKHRERCLTEALRPELHAYMATVLQNLDCAALIINSVEDHVHILLALSRTASVSATVEAVKKASSKWLKAQSPALASFSWQVGYGAFAVSKSNIGKVSEYILRQAEHHRDSTFEDEYRATLLEHAVPFDETYVWD